MARKKMKFSRKVQTGSEPSLGRIMLVIVAVLAVAGGGYWFITNRAADGSTLAVPDKIAEAQKLFEAKDFAGARAILTPFVDSSNGAQVTPAALLLLADVEYQAGDKEAALRLYERASKEYPGAKEQPRAATQYALILQELGRGQEATSILQDVQKNTAPDVRAGALVGLGKEMEQKGDLLQARQHFMDAVRDGKWDSPESKEAIAGLGRVNVSLIFAPGETPESKFYEIEKGDSFTSIGIKLNTTIGLLTRANNLTELSRLNLGQRLKYTPKDFRIVIERSACRLFLIDNNGIFKCYPVGLGMPGHETTLGKYKIGNKEKDPVWHKPGEGPIPAGDPRNELGTRWMPLVPTEEGLPTDLGIHGTIAPETIGHFSSHGCARMYKEDVEELYDLVVRSTPVEILDVFTPEDHLGAAA